MQEIIFLIIGFIAGFFAARALARRQSSIGAIAQERTSAKEENKQKIVEYLKYSQDVRNSDIQKLLKVSDWTVTRYMDELEEDGIVQQHGNTGRGVRYSLK